MLPTGLAQARSLSRVGRTACERRGATSQAMVLTLNLGRGAGWIRYGCVDACSVGIRELPVRGPRVLYMAAGRGVDRTAF